MSNTSTDTKSIVRIGDYNYLVTLETNNNAYDSYVDFMVYGFGKIVNDMPVISDMVFVPASMNVEDVEAWPTLDNSLLFKTSIDGVGSPFNDNGDNITCKTRKLKVYHPSNKKSTSMLVHAYTVVSNIKYHLLLEKNDKETTVEKETKIGKDTYSEYDSYDLIEVKSLMVSDNWIEYPYNIKITDDILDCIRYIDETGNTIVPTKVTRTITETEYQLLSTDQQQYCSQNIQDPSLYTYTRYDIQEGTTQQVKMSLLTRKWSVLSSTTTSTTIKFNKDNDISNSTTIVTLYPYTGINNGTYIPDTDMQPVATTFGKDGKISLECNIGFDNGRVSAIGTFSHPGYGTVQDFYEDTYHVDLSTYKKISEQVSEKDLEEDGILEGKSEMCGYVIQVASDNKFKSIIWEHSLYDNTVDDFSIPLIHLYTDWNQVPGSTFVRLVFLDRYIGMTITSNVKFLTKDWIRYIINDCDKERMVELATLQEFDEDKPYVPRKYNKNIEIMQDDHNHVFFLDNIRCNIIRDVEEKKSKTSGYEPRVIYKPLFYRTEDSQNITIRAGVVQNIGVNLSKYMTKVDLFYMKIGAFSFMETARNGVYVIFKVDAISNSLSENKYDILNEDAEYITTGTITYNE